MNKLTAEHPHTPLRTIPLLFLIFTSLLAISLPSSPWFMSFSQFLLAGVFVAQGVSKKEYRAFFQNNHWIIVIAGFIPWHLYLTGVSLYRQIRDLQQPSLLLAFLLFYLVHLAGVFYSSNMPEAMAALRIRLPALLIPLFFFTIRGITQKHKQLILLLFVLGTLVVSFISFYYFITDQFMDVREISPFIHHIQFSILMAWSVIIMIYARQHNWWNIPGQRILLPLVGIWFGVFIAFILKALTGVGVLLAGLYFVLYKKDAFGVRMSTGLQRTALIMIPVLGIASLAYFFHHFYDTEKIDPSTLTELTPYGNPYEHHPEEKMLENGNYVWYFVAEDELRQAWNQRSDFDFDSLDERGQQLKEILIRYMTSLGMRKDGHSLMQLDSAQISHVEQGLANYHYANDLSLYSRIYQIIWEIDRYIHTADPSDHSFTQRIESIRIGLGIARQNLLFGVGIGDIKDHYHAVYEQRTTQQKDHQRIVGAHQLLNFVVGLGLVGFLIIAFSLLYPAIRTRAFTNPLFSAFFLMSLVAMFGEDMLKFQAGITFFSFFYCYFVFLNPTENE